MEKSVEKYGYGAKQMKKSIPQFYCTNFVERYKRQAAVAGIRGVKWEWEVWKRATSADLFILIFFSNLGMTL
mgnify:CR=1 FL=1